MNFRFLFCLTFLSFGLDAAQAPLSIAVRYQQGPNYSPLIQMHITPSTTFSELESRLSDQYGPGNLWYQNHDLSYEKILNRPERDESIYATAGDNPIILGQLGRRLWFIPLRSGHQTKPTHLEKPSNTKKSEPQI